MSRASGSLVSPPPAPYVPFSLGSLEALPPLKWTSWGLSSVSWVAQGLCSSSLGLSAEAAPWPLLFGTWAPEALCGICVAAQAARGHGWGVPGCVWAQWVTCPATPLTVTPPCPPPQPLLCFQDRMPSSTPLHGWHPRGPWPHPQVLLILGCKMSNCQVTLPPAGGDRTCQQKRMAYRQQRTLSHPRGPLRAAAKGDSKATGLVVFGLQRVWGREEPAP